MLVIVQKGKEDTAKRVFEKWDLNCVQIGTVTNGGSVKVAFNGITVAEVPAKTLVLGGDAPVYKRESKEPGYFKELREFDFNPLPEPKDYNEVLLRLLSSPNITNKNWVYEQYDTQVRTNTIVLPGGDASVVRIKGTTKALAMKTDCNGRYVYLNPYKGGAIAVCESARNVACTGAEPLAITNCLNFGNPYKPEVYYQFQEAIMGIGDACRELNTPVTGGNVSFYNESPDYAVYPTPTIGMVGIIENIDYLMTSHFKNEGDVIAIISGAGQQNEKFDGLGGSEYVKLIHGKVTGDAPDIDINTEKKLITCVRELIGNKQINSAHDVSEGGIAVAIAESCLMKRTSPIGCNVNIKYRFRKDFSLFNESQSRIVISFNKSNEEKVKEICVNNHITYTNIGTVGGKSVLINEDININLEKAKDAYYNSIVKIMESD
jgi:phosphoribosylformylglycinamidine synthase